MSIGGQILILDRLRFLLQRDGIGTRGNARLHAIQRPHQVDRGGTRCSQGRKRGLECASTPLGGQHHAPGGGNADGRRSTHDQIADGLGYLIGTATKDLVEGRKSFQPEPESHLQMEIRIVCAPDTPDGKVSLGFVTALQDVYALKKSNNSASLGVGALGSVSLPFSSSNDAMIKVASKTIASDIFYDRFFDLVKRFLVADETQEMSE